MDKLTSLATSKLAGGGGSSDSKGDSSNQQEDYLDKGELNTSLFFFWLPRNECHVVANTFSVIYIAVDSIEKKEGLDPSKLRDKNEMVTDAARDQFEKHTGYVVSQIFFFFFY